MPLPTAIPYGLRDVQLTPYTTDAATALGTPVDLPNSRTFSFVDVETFQTLRGDDTDVAEVGSGPSVNWSLEAGGISLDAYKVLAGGTITESGTTPDIVVSLKKTTTTRRPYFKAEGQAISDSGGDMHGIVWKCRATGNIEGSMGDGVFWLTGASGRGIAATLTGQIGDVYDFVQNETATAIGAP